MHNKVKFECRACGKRCDTLVPLDDHSKLVCPHCSSTALTRYWLCTICGHHDACTLSGREQYPCEDFTLIMDK